MGAIICIALEATAYWYIKQIIKHNELQHTKDIGILHKWLSYRDAIQFDHRYSQYDSVTIYKFIYNLNRHFSDLEFNTQIQTNSIGLRDDEMSINYPKIIFSGDSFTMGWGVDQNKTYAQQTEKQLHTKCLNAGISSFGTCREALMLDRLKKDSCKVLVLQYCQNDLEENYIRGDSLKTTVKITPSLYDKITDGNTINSGYFPMRYSYFFLREKDLIRRIFTPHSGVKKDLFDLINEIKQINNEKIALKKDTITTIAEGKPERHAHYFFKWLWRIRQIYKGKIVVINLNSRSTDNQYINAFERENLKNPDPNLYFLPLHNSLKPEHYFVIDDHLNAKGHQKVADEIVNFIKRKQLL